jgi:RNA polymerase sigma-70 factor (ECF subfamily)
MSSSMTPQQTLAARRGDFVAFVERRVRDRALAEDLVQAAFEHAVMRIDDLRDDDAVVAWFYRSLRNAIVDRQRRRTTEGKAFDALAREVDDWVDAIVAAPPRVCRCVLRVAHELKPEYADALQSIEVDGAAVKDFAAQHGISRSNAAVRVFRAREALRRGILATCGACAEGGCVDCTCGDGASAKGCH